MGPELSEVKLEPGDVKITIKTGSDEKETIVQHVPMGGQMQQMAAQPQQQHQQQQAPAPSQENDSQSKEEQKAPAGEDSNYITVKSNRDILP